MRGCRFHSFNDVVIAGATTDVSSDAFPNLAIRGLWIVAQEFQSAEKHSWSAKPTLQSMVLPESFLQRMEFTHFRQAFNGRHFRPIGLNSKDETRADGLAI
jgi:hypothetical protein